MNFFKKLFSKKNQREEIEGKSKSQKTPKPSSQPAKQPPLVPKNEIETIKPIAEPISIADINSWSDLLNAYNRSSDPINDKLLMSKYPYHTLYVYIKNNYEDLGMRPAFFEAIPFGSIKETVIQEAWKYIDHPQIPKSIAEPGDSLNPNRYFLNEASKVTREFNSVLDMTISKCITDVSDYLEGGSVNLLDQQELLDKAFSAIFHYSYRPVVNFFVTLPYIQRHLSKGHKISREHQVYVLKGVEGILLEMWEELKEGEIITDDLITRKVTGILNSQNKKASSSLESRPNKISKNWYSVKRGEFDQIVINVPNGIAQDSELGMIMLTKAYSYLVQHPLTTGLFGLDNKTGPYLMIRADNLVNEIKNSTIKIAITFCKMPSGGLLAIYVESPSIAKNAQSPFLERAYGLDTNELKSLIENTLRKDTLDLVLVDGKGAKVSDSGSFVSMDALYGEVEIKIPIQKELKAVLNDKFKELLEYHDSLNSKDFQNSMNELWDKVPGDESPIFKKPAKTEPERESEASEENWLDYLKHQGFEQDELFMYISYLSEAVQSKKSRKQVIASMPQKFGIPKSKAERIVTFVEGSLLRELESSGESTAFWTVD